MTIRAVLALLLLFLLSIVCIEARADSEARVGADWVRITALPCSNPMVVAILEQAGEDPRDYRAASAHFDGKDFAGCWRPLYEQRAAYLRYEDGDQGLVPFSDLKPVQSI